jgi:hypothetical protein
MKSLYVFKNIAAEAPKSQFTTAQEFTAETKSDRIQDKTPLPQALTVHLTAIQVQLTEILQIPVLTHFPQMGESLGKIGKELGKALEKWVKSLASSEKNSVSRLMTV